MNLLWKTYLPLSLAFILFINSILWSFSSLSSKWCI
jgi:hypothetical protein